MANELMNRQHAQIHVPQPSMTNHITHKHPFRAKQNKTTANKKNIYWMYVFIILLSQNN
jgi:hypothetical protein